MEYSDRELVIIFEINVIKIKIGGKK